MRLVGKPFVGAWLVSSAVGVANGCKPASPPAAGSEPPSVRSDWSKPAVGCSGMPAGLLDSKTALETVEEPVAGKARPKSKSNAEGVVDGMRKAFRTCHDEQLRRDPRGAGKVLLQLSVDCDGSVHSIHAEGNGVDQQALRCLIATASRGQFKAPPSGSTEIRIPLTFAQPHASVAPLDASAAVDASAPSDASLVADGAAPDASAPVDASAPPDVSPPVDGSAPSDASAPTDGSAPSDAGTIGSW